MSTQSQVEADITIEAVQAELRLWYWLCEEALRILDGLDEERTETVTKRRWEFGLLTYLVRHGVDVVLL